MSAKRYKAADMRRALQMVREDLGADAVILSSARTDAGFEVVACADREWRKVSGDSSVKTPAQANADEGMLDDERVAARADDVPMQRDLQRDDQRVEARLAESERRLLDMRDALQGELRSELQELREWLEMQWQQHPVVPVADNRFASLRQKLEQLGVPSSLHAQILRDAPPAGDERLRWRGLMSALATRLPCLPDEERIVSGQLALVGPSGAGKTTTLQKLAVRHALRYGNHQVGIISLDAERIGAQQALNVFCHMLDVPLKIAQDRDSLDLALRSLRNRSLVLIDIPGNHIGSEGQQKLFALLRAFPSIVSYLTLPSTVQYPVMTAWWRACDVLAPQALVLTKLDEAPSLGEAVGICFNSQLPLAWVTDGPQIPRDLHTPDIGKLLARAVELARVAEKPARDNRRQPSIA